VLHELISYLPNLILETVYKIGGPWGFIVLFLTYPVLIYFLYKKCSKNQHKLNNNKIKCNKTLITIINIIYIWLLAYFVLVNFALYY
jgi:uncharacterized membrane protein